MSNKRRKPEIELGLNNCPKADDVNCDCGETLTPYAYTKSFLGKYKYFYKCNNCGKKYKK